MTDAPTGPPNDPPTEFPPRTSTDTHDFAPFIRILGRGPGRSRSLTRAEARLALGMVLRGEATREQVGAMLMLLRYRGEEADEIVGLVEAARDHASLPWRFSRPVDLDWPSYADGRTRGLPWYLLAALLVARAGVRVMMHGPSVGPGRQPLVDALGALSIPPSTTAAAAEQSLSSLGFAFVPIEALSPDIAALLALRGVLGLRSPLNTVGRLLDPANAAGSIDGVFHPAYIALHLAVAECLGRRIAVLKGGGGEAEWTGVKPLVLTSRAGEVVWRALEGAGKPTGLSTADLVSVWHGTRADPAAEAIVIATSAVALHAAGRADDPAACVAMARGLWDSRPVRP